MKQNCAGIDAGPEPEHKRGGRVNEKISVVAWWLNGSTSDFFFLLNTFILFFFV
jgi:hypothetical protein